MVVEVAAGLASLIVLVLGFRWADARGTSDATRMTLRRPIARSTAFAASVASRRRRDSSSPVPRPSGLVVPVDAFWDVLLGELRPISEELDYRVALAQLDSRSSKKTIMVVDDEPEVRQVIRRFLETYGGYQVIPCSGLDQVAQELEAGRHELHALVTDVAVGRGVTGALICATVRAYFPKLPVVFISGYPNVSVPGQHVLAKPFEKDELLEVVKEALGEGGPRKAPTDVQEG